MRTLFLALALLLAAPAQAAIYEFAGTCTERTRFAPSISEPLTCEDPKIFIEPIEEYVVRFTMFDSVFDSSHWTPGYFSATGLGVFDIVATFYGNFDCCVFKLYEDGSWVFSAELSLYRRTGYRITGINGTLTQPSPSIPLPGTLALLSLGLLLLKPRRPFERRESLSG